MPYTQDQKMLHRIRELLMQYFCCSYGDVSRVLKILVLECIRKSPNLGDDDTDSAEYYVILNLALEQDDLELAELIHCYSVGYFSEDTKSYQIKQGEKYEITNRNYLTTYMQCGLGENKAS